MPHLKPFSRPTPSRSIAVLLVLASVFLLASCGSGGGGGTTSASRSLPPDPGAAATATVAGVDTNNNGVRDEVEIALSKVITSDEQYAASILVAKETQKILLQPTPKTRAEALLMESKIMCAVNKAAIYSVKGKDVYVEKTFDTKERQYKYQDYLIASQGGYAANELTKCP